MSEEEQAYREYISSEEAMDGIADNAQSTEGNEIKMVSREQMEARVTVRLSADDLDLIDAACKSLGVGRSTFLRMAARAVAQTGNLPLAATSDTPRDVA